jgi:four helix bundle protein
MAALPAPSVIVPPAVPAQPAVPATPQPAPSPTAGSGTIAPDAEGAAARRVEAVLEAQDPEVPSDEALDAVQLDASKLQCYQVALELHTLCSTLVALLNRIVRDQLERASLSVVLNIAEAGGRRSRRDKARYYAIARGSATEVAALFDVLAMRHLAPAAAIRTGRRLAIRVVQMLTRMDQKLLP